MKWKEYVFFYLIVLLFLEKKGKSLESLSFILYYLSIDRSNDKWSNENLLTKMDIWEKENDVI
jgi:hypothetical protein